MSSSANITDTPDTNETAGIPGMIFAGMQEILDKFHLPFNLNNTLLTTCLRGYVGQNIDEFEQALELVWRGHRAASPLPRPATFCEWFNAKIRFWVPKPLAAAGGGGGGAAAAGTEAGGSDSSEE
ncbi:hypothetical protein BO83DRAFT_418702 [Aspergillus eucalypticola CBS 122712]|uniref:Uncharacterized protein n=1 Tax=Aspergillus eucalypticola (strain CBS 122712 / IBT 29274) TaxID=1448314 RepID=A0A317V760_ASPEC|nr:uncharacterized protein BO83DRAFT_418702 [Aspergillus eucalypticola CBS 122712]PWY68797.1 hypothetical protein BO83DRAFT_418702 [Aspergillus eucalypticola CBS 122712]